MKYLLTMMLGIIICFSALNPAYAENNLSLKSDEIQSSAKQKSSDRLYMLEQEVKELRNKVNQIEKQLMNKANVTHSHTCSYSGGSTVYCY